MRPTTKLRQIMAEKKTIIKPGTYDAMSAKIMEICGFKAIGISGYSISVTYLGKPDLGFVSLTELAAICRNIASTVSIPVIADADTGFGNAINVLYTTDLLIKTGIAAFHIEDQEFPKRCGHVGGKKVIATEEMVGKIKAAAKVRDEMDKDFVIIARSDVRGVRNGTLQQLIDRCNAYLEAGADMVFPEGLPSEEELRELTAKVDGPIHYNRTGKNGAGVSPFVPLSTLQDIGVCIASQAAGPLLAAGHAMWEWGSSVMKEDSEALLRQDRNLKATPLENLHQFSGMRDYLELEKLYLPQEESGKYDKTLGFKS